MILKHSSRALLTAWIVFRVLTSGHAVAAGNDYQVKPGFNLVGVTTSLRSQYVSAFPLLNAWKGAPGVTAIESYDHASGAMLRAELNGGAPGGSDFPLNENGALFVYAGSGGTASLGDNSACSPPEFKTGFNLASFFCLSANFTSSELLASLGVSSILSISRFDNTSARWITTAVDGATIVGERFNIVPGEGYVIYASADVLNWTSPTQKLVFNPDTLTVRQEQTGASLNLTIPYPAPAGGLNVDLMSTDTSVLTVPSSVTISQGTTSASVAIAPLLSGSTVDQLVEVHASSPNWTSGKAVVTVRPKPTVNLSPATTLTGQGWTYFLTVSLTEAAPVGGLAVTLASSPAGIVSCPATVVISEGALSTQVTATATTIGTATITASAPGKALSGTTNVVTVKAIQTIGIGPTMSAPVGIMVSSSTATAPMTTYTPIISRAVGVNVGSVVTGLAPNHGAVGTADMILRVNGYGLSTATTITFNPPDGITAQNGSLFNAPDGSYVEVPISIDANAPISQRTVLVSTSTGVIPPASPGANIFRVTYPQPEILGLNPIRGQVGSLFTMTVSGKDLFSAGSIDFTPTTGVSVNNPPTVGSDGATATVTVFISADAPTGARVVTVTTPAGTTSNTPSAANTFTVTTDAGVTYPSIVSQSVGVLVTSATATTMQSATYSPTLSLPVGVAVGPVITSVTPPSGAIGSTGLLVRVNGSDLVSATSLTFTPSTGITIQEGTFSVAGDGSFAEVMIDIAQDAPLTPRTVLLGGIAALPSAPGANIFRVTYPQPEILGINPIRGQVGSTFTLSVLGKNLNSASGINFSPVTGISVNNPPAVSGDGSTATVTVSIAANAPTGASVVTVTTPGGTTSSVASAANAFTVTTDAGTIYAPVTSQAVGVLVTSATSTTTQPATYSPVLSLPIGVVVMSAPMPTTQDVNYSPIVSRNVGVSVGASVTGLTSNTIEPGTTSVITINGVGLDQVNAVQIQPSTGFTINAVTPSVDGLSVTVSISVDAGVSVGTKTVIISSPSGMIPPASAGANLLFTGPKPVINSIVPILEVANGIPFTLTVHGAHLQGATEVRILGTDGIHDADGIHVNNPPTYYTDTEGEHAAVTVIIDSNATGGQRTVIISTPYGTTDPAPTAANIFTVDQPVHGWNLPMPGDDKPALARANTDAPAPVQENGSKLDPSAAMFASVVPRTRTDKRLSAATETALTVMYAPSRPSYGVREIIGDDRKRNYRLAGYRGPPSPYFG